AVRLRVTNRNASVRYFSSTALHLADADGAIVDDALALTPPIPAASGDYYPGSTGEGWVAWDTEDKSFALVRIDLDPFADDPRFFALESTPVATTGGESADNDPLPVAPGDPVVVTETEVNLRAEPTTDGDIVATLDRGDRLVITGEPVPGDGYRWYPVEVDATGETGFIVQEFIATP
ncbi:MAG: SH3 domain-containing protein, partial [Chloroflexia bacterium]|nr:SH3 domain-containing protein [Chloroflexia bacterium]